MVNMLREIDRVASLLPPTLITYPRSHLNAKINSPSALPLQAITVRGLADLIVRAKGYRSKSQSTEPL